MSDFELESASMALSFLKVEDSVMNGDGCFGVEMLTDEKRVWKMFEIFSFLRRNFQPPKLW